MQQAQDKMFVYPEVEDKSEITIDDVLERLPVPTMDKRCRYVFEKKVVNCHLLIDILYCGCACPQKPNGYQLLKSYSHKMHSE